MENKITRKSKLKDVYLTPSGHDIIARLLYSLGIGEGLITSSFIGNLTINGIKKISFGKLDDAFIDALLILLNSQTEMPIEDNQDITPKWWKQAVFYQIYPRSFKDSNNDGIGDIQGIISKLDYLKTLGVDVIWCSPLYDSPNDDNGYDIRNYKAILAEFGTMEDFDELLKEVHARGMKLIMDLVLNHTSDEHEWFQDCLKNPASPYQDFYFWREGTPDNPPNNWTSMFSGAAWKYFEEKKAWALHIFSSKQMDLNWDNPKLREEIYSLTNYWLEKGIDGFRLDVISYISKADGLPNGDIALGNLIGFRGIEHYFHGPHLDEYLQELRQKTFGNYDTFTVGECPGNGIQLSRLISGDDRGELDSVFSFDHTENPGKKRFDIYRFKLKPMIDELINWQMNYSNHCWPIIFFENHDLTRMASKVCPENYNRNELSKLLATLLATLKGTPFIYQGQEIGMTNCPFNSIEDIKDVESSNKYQEYLSNKMKASKAFSHILAGSRDNARTPMQWSKEANGGFSSVRPWIMSNPNYETINVENELEDNNSVLNYFIKAIALRHQYSTLIYGKFELVKNSNKCFSYYRSDNDNKFYIEINITNKYQTRPLEVTGYENILTNYSKPNSILRPFEVNVYKLK